VVGKPWFVRARRPLRRGPSAALVPAALAALIPAALAALIPAALAARSRRAAPLARATIAARIGLGAARIGLGAARIGLRAALPGAPFRARSRLAAALGAVPGTAARRPSGRLRHDLPVRVFQAHDRSAIERN
jgi:hypothetical protein